jgi:antitoxin PrlF
MDRQGNRTGRIAASSDRAYNCSVGVRLTDKGQVTIPKQVRDELGLRPGDEVEFVADGNGGYRLRKVLRTNPFSRYRGHLTGLAGRRPDDLVSDLRGGAG